MAKRDPLLDTDWETALEKTQHKGSRLTGETLRIEMVVEVPVDKNWILSQQIVHLLDDLTRKSSLASFLRDIKHGYGWRGVDDPRQADLDEVAKAITVTVSSPHTTPRKFPL